MNDTVKKAPAAQPVSLKSLMTPSKTVEFEYPGCDDFIVSLCYLAREELMKLRNRCTKQVFNKKTRSYEEQMDDDKFLEWNCFSCIIFYICFRISSHWKFVRY